MRNRGGFRKKGILWLGCLALTLLLGFAGTGVTAGATPVSSNRKLSVRGTKIVNAKGKTFRMKGVSTHGLAWFPQYVSKAAFRDLRDKWGVNTVRLAMYTAEDGGYRSGGDKAALKAKIREGVKAATDLGMYVIIDWHILNDRNQPFDRAGQKAAIGFFKEMAKKYRDQNNVLYEICNEPNSGNGGSWGNIRTYADAVIREIRKIDSDAIIIVGTPTWSQDVDEAAKNPLSGSNLVYALHFYAGTHGESYRRKAEAAVSAGLPLLVSEFGITDASGNDAVNTSEGDRWIRFLDKYGIGYVAWNLSNKNESSALLKSSTKKTSGWTWSNLSKSGQWLVKTYGGKLAGTAAASGKSGTSKAAAGEAAADRKTATNKKTAASAKSARATVRKVNSWYDGQRCFTQYTLTVKNTGKKKISGWKVKISFSHAIEKSGDWNGRYTYGGDYLTVRPVSWNRTIAAKKSVTDIGFIVSSPSEKNKVTSVKFAE